MAVNVPDHLAGVGYIGAGEVGLIFTEQRDDFFARLMTY